MARQLPRPIRTMVDTIKIQNIERDASVSRAAHALNWSRNSRQQLLLLLLDRIQIRTQVRLKGLDFRRNLHWQLQTRGSILGVGHPQSSDIPTILTPGHVTDHPAQEAADAIAWNLQGCTLALGCVVPECIRAGCTHPLLLAAQNHRALESLLTSIQQLLGKALQGELDLFGLDHHILVQQTCRINRGMLEHVENGSASSSSICHALLLPATPQEGDHRREVQRRTVAGKLFADLGTVRHSGPLPHLRPDSRHSDPQQPSGDSGQLVSLAANSPPPSLSASPPHSPPHMHRNRCDTTVTRGSEPLIPIQRISAITSNNCHPAHRPSSHPYNQSGTLFQISPERKQWAPAAADTTLAAAQQRRGAHTHTPEREGRVTQCAVWQLAEGSHGQPCFFRILKSRSLW